MVLMETVDMSYFTIYSKSKHIYKISSRYYSIALIDFEKVFIARQLNINICPIYLIYPKFFDTIPIKTIPRYITIDDFLNDYKRSDLKMFDYISNHKKEIDTIKNETKLGFSIKYAMSSIILETFHKKSI